jgi:hypothetical protein
MLLATADAIDTRMGLMLTSEAQKMYEAKSRHIINDFARKWSGILNTRSLQFECDTDEATYITRPKDAVYIHRSVAWALNKDPCTWFVDAFACVGGDTLAAMNQFKEANISAVQRTMDERESRRFDRLCQNIEVFKRIVQGRNPDSKVNAIGKDIQSFIEEIDPVSDISVLYLDPPWVLTPGQPSYSTPAEIESFLDTNVWTPLMKKTRHPLVIVLKLPTSDIRDIVSWPKLSTNYTLCAHISPRDRYSVYILRRNDDQPQPLQRLQPP